MRWLVAAWSCAEAVLFFIVVDVPLSAIALTRGARPALVAALIAAFAAIPDALIAHQWAVRDADGQRRAFLALPAIDETLVDSTAAAWRASSWRAALAGSFSGVPFKLYASAAGHAGTPVATLLLQTPLLRLPRYLATIALTLAVSRTLPAAWSARRRLRLLALCWLTFYAFYFTMR